MKDFLLTSFLSNGIKNGSLILKLATTVIIGSRQLNIDPKMSIFPSFGSTGSIERLRPITTPHFTTLITKFIWIGTPTETSEICKIKQMINKTSTLILPSTVRFSFSSKAPIAFKYSIAFSTWKGNVEIFEIQKY